MGQIILVTQLSQRNRAAGCASFWLKVEDCDWETILRSTFNHCDVIGL